MEDDSVAIHRRGQFYARFIGKDTDDASPNFAPFVPYPDSYRIWVKIGDSDLIVDRKDVENLRALCDDILASWGK